MAENAQTGKRISWATLPGVLYLLTLIAAIALPVVQAFGQTPFWNSKELQSYSDGEKLQVMTNSPWAKVVHSEVSKSGPSGTWGGFNSSPGGDRNSGPPFASFRDILAASTRAEAGYETSARVLWARHDSVGDGQPDS